MADSNRCVIERDVIAKGLYLYIYIERNILEFEMKITYGLPVAAPKNHDSILSNQEQQVLDPQ